MRKSDISASKQSFIALYDSKKGFSYLPPGELLAVSIIPISLSAAFKEFCFYGFSTAIEIGAVAGQIRDPYPNELWKNTADTLVTLNTIKCEHLASDTWSLYRGLECLIRNAYFPIFIPEQSLVYNGRKVLDYLDGSLEHSTMIKDILCRWKGLSAKMEKEIT